MPTNLLSLPLSPLLQPQTTGHPLCPRSIPPRIIMPSHAVPIVEYSPPSSFGTDMTVLKHMWFAKIVPGQSQQDRVRVMAPLAPPIPN